MKQQLKSQLQNILHKEIIATKVLEFSIAHIDNDYIELEAPIKTNINDKKTAFGGSISALCMISGWSLCWLISAEHKLNADIVIYKSSMDFHLPVLNDFKTRVHFPSNEKLQKLLKRLQAHKKASLELEITIEENGKKAVSFYGKYVFLLPN